LGGIGVVLVDGNNILFKDEPSVGLLLRCPADSELSLPLLELRFVLTSTVERYKDSNRDD
jgi:hypothetical protein